MDDLSDEKPVKDVTQPYFRKCFNTEAGQRVLVNILQEAGYFDTNRNTIEDLAILNFVKLNILRKIGLLKPNNVDSYVRKLFEIPVIQEQKNG
ncbi:hypothetical protein LCGC14_2350330 [marine sediment metagenome]|uniref:Uncharacterized protein n=1 Tax=marine sediment metagenome TaxID=412755 RepID=A0A0F9CWV5_9ZZZZ